MGTLSFKESNIKFLIRNNFGITEIFTNNKILFFIKFKIFLGLNSSKDSKSNKSV